MGYIRLGNFEIFSETFNWTASLDGEYRIETKKDYGYLLSPEVFEETIETKIGKGWRLPTLSEMTYVGNIHALNVLKSEKIWVPMAYNYIVKETTIPSERDGNRRIFYYPVTNSENVQPWIPGFFHWGEHPKTFKILPVREIKY